MVNGVRGQDAHHLPFPVLHAELATFFLGRAVGVGGASWLLCSGDGELAMVYFCDMCMHGMTLGVGNNPSPFSN